MNMKSYYEALGEDPFDVIPVTFHVKEIGDKSYQEFVSYFDLLNEDQISKNIWIVKPGENTNRGYGIQVVRSKEEVENFISGELENN